MILARDEIRSILTPVSRTLAVVVLLTGGIAMGQSKVPISWKGKKLDAATLPKDLDPAPSRAIAQWEPWAKKAGYRMDLDTSGRVLVLTPGDSSRAGSILKLVGRAESWFDGLAPKPTPRTGDPIGASREAASETKEVIPEDPEGPPPGAEKKAPSKSTGLSWGAGSIEPDSQTATLIAVANEKDQQSLLEFLGTARPELREWTLRAATDLGFVLEIPLVAAYVESASGQEEWNADHEVLHRTVRLLCLRRFGQLPNWLVHAVAWEAEHAFDGSIWVYPYRSEFVFTTEHTAWPSELANEFEDRAKILGIEQLTHWKSRTWDGECARHAFGFFHYLAAAKKAELPNVLEDLRRYRDANNRKPAPDGTWIRDPEWEPPPEAQAAILRARCGNQVMENASAWLAEPSSARPRTDSHRK